MSQDLAKQDEARVTFAGGCFWCVEHDLREVPGVLDAVSGYAGKENASPSYEDHGRFREAVEIAYDPAKTSFKKLSQFFLDHIDPTDAGGQFYDRGESYKTAIYYRTEEEKEIAKGLLKELEESAIYDKPVAVEVLPMPAFYKAEDYHQKYASKNPGHYEAYRQGSGRADFVGRTCMIRDEKKISWKD